MQREGKQLSPMQGVHSAAKVDRGRAAALAAAGTPLPRQAGALCR